jgi:hypothetical protein
MLYDESGLRVAYDSSVEPGRVPAIGGPTGDEEEVRYGEGYFTGVLPAGA